MELLVALAFFFAVWLTFLTYRLKEQKRISKDLAHKNKVYLRELMKLGHEQEKKGNETEEA